MNTYIIQFKRRSFFAGVVLTLFLIFPFTANAQPQELWSQQGAGFDPDLFSGSATYSVPIGLPAGRNGLQPSLGLSYSSLNQDDGSILGSGWSIPVNRIVRRPETSIMDQYTDGAFALEFNGSYVKLEDIALSVGEYGSYGAAVEGSFMEVSFNTNDSWTVTTKDGVEMTFGTVAASRLDNPSDAGQIYAWYLEKIRDLNDNYISYTYFKDAGNVYPATINYTGHNVTDGPMTVRFEPFATGVPVARADASSSYKSGFAVDYNYLLDSVEVDVAGQGTVQSYDFVYITGDNGYRSLLESVSRSGLASDGSAIMLPPWEFSYTQATDGWTENQTYIFPETDLGSISSGIGDYNADGYLDVLILDENSGVYTKEMWTGGRDGFIEETLAWSLPDVQFEEAATIIADINGDSYTDFAFSLNNTRSLYAVYLNDGNNGFTDVSATWSVPTEIDFDWEDVKFADVNGDGILDIVFQNNCASLCETYVWHGDGMTGWTDVSVDYALPVTDDIAGYTFVDMNKDGLSDIFMFRELSPGNWDKQLYLNVGNGMWEDVSTSWTIPNMTYHSLTDVNGDGLLDFYKYNQSVGNCTVFLYSGNGWEWEPNYQSITCPGSTDSDSRFMDISGDTVSDHIFVNWNGTAWQTSLKEHDGEVPDLLSTVSLPEGGAVSYSYNGNIQFESSPGVDANPNLPSVFPVVNEVTYDDGLGNQEIVTYNYEGGAYSYSDVYNGRFAGFHKVTKTYSDNSSEVTYFHQGGGEDGSALGEATDDYDLIGRSYREEVRDNNGNLLQTSITDWERVDIGNERVHLRPVQGMTFTYRADGSHQDTSVAYNYDSYGNVITETRYGEVVGNENGSYTDIVGDTVTIERDYVTTTNPYLTGLPSKEVVRDNSGIMVANTEYVYDGLPLQSAVVGSLTKQRSYISAVDGWVEVDHAYDLYGNILTVTDPNTNTTTYTYDAQNMYPVTETNALSQVTQFTTDLATGQQTRVEDANGIVVEYDYDSFGRVEEERRTDPDNLGALVTTQMVAYDTVLSPQQITTTNFRSATDSTTNYVYLDGFGRVVQTRDQSVVTIHSTTDIIYDSAGRPVRTSLPYHSTGAAFTGVDLNQEAINTTYDSLGRVLTVQDSVGSVSHSYEAYTQATTDELGNVKSYTNDAFGRLIQVEEVDGVNTLVTTYEYDTLGNLISMEDADANVRDFEYDALSRRILMTNLYDVSEINPSSWSYTYDTAGNLIQMDSPDGQQVQYTYDVLQRMTSEDDLTQSGTEVSYTYDTTANGIGQLANATRGTVVTDLAYSAQGGIASETKTIDGNVFTTSYTYDFLGNQLTKTLPDGSILTTTYDIAGRVYGMSLDGTSIVSYVDYNANGQETEIASGNGIVTTSLYDQGNRYWLDNRITFNDVEDLQNLSYTYDSAGNITQIEDQSNTATLKTMVYTYDDLYRLTNATSSGSLAGNYDYSYTYDAIGNMLTHPVQGTMTYAGTGNGANPHALTNVGGTAWTYDGSGNLVDDGVYTYDYNYQNQMTLSDDGSVQVAYTYDHSGDRVKKEEASDSKGKGGGNKKNGNGGGNKGPVVPATYYVGDYVYMADDGSYEVQVALNGEPVFERNVDSVGATTDRWIHTDHLGNVAVMTDSNGDWTTVRDYYPFGEERVHETRGATTTNRFDYGNKERDETGLSYFEARYMSTAIGRFTILDPVFLAASSTEWLVDPQSQNSYAYARNNPIVLIDPTGLWNARTGEVEEGDTLGAITSTINQLYDTNYDYNQIAASNGIDDPSSISVGQIIEPNAFTPDVSVDLVEKMERNASDLRIQNPFYFKNKVKTGGDWDLKNQEGIYCTNSSCGGEKHDFFFLGKTIRYDAPGNIHYGYVGSQTWYGSPKFLQKRADKAQNRDNNTTSGDDFSDKSAISFGIYLHGRK